MLKSDSLEMKLTGAESIKNVLIFFLRCKTRARITSLANDKLTCFKASSQKNSPFQKWQANDAATGDVVKVELSSTEDTDKGK